MSSSCASPTAPPRKRPRSGLEAGAVVIDLSADHRLADAAAYHHWYGAEHLFPESLGEAVYGLTEWRREALRSARLIANPGCYPTSILMALAPLLRAGHLGGATIIADSKSGASGAGALSQGGLAVRRGQREPEALRHWPRAPPRRGDGAGAGPASGPPPLLPGSSSPPISCR